MIEAPAVLRRQRHLHQSSAAGRESETRLVLVPPHDRSDLWAAYRAGAFAAYARHRVEHALALPEIGYDEDRPWFEVAIGARGAVVGGLRINGPLRHVREAAALSELADHPQAAAALTRVLRERIAGGIAEVKGFWVRHDEPDRGRIAAALAGSVAEVGRVLGVDHLFCTAAEHAIPRWLAAGAHRLASVPPVPYPDSRYSTIVLWWDRGNRRGT